MSGTDPTAYAVATFAVLTGRIDAKKKRMDALTKDINSIAVEIQTLEGIIQEATKSVDSQNTPPAAFQPGATGHSVLHSRLIPPFATERK